MRKKLARLIRRYRLAWAVVTVLLYVVAVPFTIVIFPENNMWLGLLVLFSGFTASMTTLAELVTDEDDGE
jgi:hypothetical protein